MYVDGLKQTGKNCIVVGAGGGGHGTEITRALLEAGAFVSAWDRSADALTSLRESMGGLSERLQTHCVDATSSAEVANALQQVVAARGPVDALTNVVGGTRPDQWCSIEDCTDEIFEAVLTLNLKSAFYTCRDVGRHMIACGTKGSIVNISSVSGQISAPEHAPYGASKSGLDSLSRTMAIEWSRYGIRVNVISPGAMTVPRLGYLHSQQPQGAESIPLGVRGRPFDVAGAALFLHSELASYMTGHTLVVDGGLCAKTPFGSEVVRRLTTQPIPKTTGDNK